MKHNVFFSVFDLNFRKDALKKRLKENGSAEMLYHKGGVYKIFAIVKNTENEEEMVAYRCIKPHTEGDFKPDMETFWVTPIDKFLEPIDLEQEPGSQFDFKFMFKEDAEQEMKELLTGQRD